MRITIKELINEIYMETGIEVDENEVLKMYQSEKNQNNILNYKSEDYIMFVEKILNTL